MEPVETVILITCDWNTKDPASGYVGYVTRFAVRTEFLDRYEVHQVGDSLHTEYWIPAAALEDLNANLLGEIEVIAEFR